MLSPKEWAVECNCMVVANQVAMEDLRRRHQEEVRTLKRAADALEERLSAERAQRKEVDANMLAAERYWALMYHASNPDVLAIAVAVECLLVMISRCLRVFPNGKCSQPLSEGVYHHCVRVERTGTQEKTEETKQASCS